MFNVPWIEWVGYSASAMIAISLLMTDIHRIRVINTIGCILFIIYGIGVGAYPVAIANAIIIIINIYHIFKLKKAS
ncbi:YgjV family protein [Cellulosilyticum ruminicola]|uniref:YgjV family protein n=1 Tax=Cellulosilyticum ruminicola TaxID=425254 RepID=UPI0006CF9694|nr:YgjV family protein [Cellulosilyticum ruminicola]